MATSERKKRETEKLRERVLDEAEDVFAKEGVERITMRRLAARIEYAPTVLYRLFRNKDDLLDHLIARGYQGVRARYEDILRSSELGSPETLHRLVSSYVAYALEHPNHYRMWFETGRLRWTGSELVLRHGRLEFVVFRPWLDCIAACAEHGTLPRRDPLQVFQILWARVHGVISLRLQQPEFPWMPLEQHLNEALDLSFLPHPSWGVDGTGNDGGPRQP